MVRFIWLEFIAESEPKINKLNMNRNFPIFPEMTAGPWRQLCSVCQLSRGPIPCSFFYRSLFASFLSPVLHIGGSFPADRWVILLPVIVKPNWSWSQSSTCSGDYLIQLFWIRQTDSISRNQRWLSPALDHTVCTSHIFRLITDKNENESFLINKKIQNGAVAKSYMTNDGLLIRYMGKYLRISSYIRKPFLIYDFAIAPLSIS